MRVSLKILLTLLFVAVLPVAVSGMTSVVLAREAVAAAASDKLETEAQHLAELAETTITRSLDDLRQSANLGLAQLSPDEATGALWVIYRGDSARSAVALLDGTTGESVVAPVSQATPAADGTDPGMAEHEAFPESASAAFAEHIPLAEALAAGKAIGVPYADPVRGAPLIALAVRVPGQVDKAGVEHPYVVATELSLRRLNKRFEEAADDKLVAYLVDLEGKAVCHTVANTALQRTSMLSAAGVVAMRDTGRPASGVVQTTGTDPSLVAWARAPRLAAASGLAWGVVVERDRREALAAVERLSERTAFWVGTALVLALVAGVLLARGIARPIEVLTSIVERFAAAANKRDASLRAPRLGGDEIGVLAGAFNRMADDLDDYTRQLRSFNDELQQKVEDRTRELKDAQNQLIQSQKMAAVGELGAGVAHEINNPLAGVLGSAQLALLRVDKDDTRVRPHLQDIEREGLRIRDIVESLLKLSQDQGAQASGSLDVNSVVDGAVALLARPIIAQRIQVKKALAPELPKIRGNAADLQQAVMQLLSNAKDAMPQGGTLTIRTEGIEGRLVKVSVEDTGPGVPAHLQERIFEPFFTTHASKGNKGMGLAIVHRIVQEHGGRINVDSQENRGAAFRMVFPATRESLHLV